MYQYGETVILHKEGPVEYDRWGDPISTTEDIEIHGVAVMPGRTLETVDSTGTLIHTPLKVVSQEAIDVSNHDTMTVRGKKYEVISDTSGPKINPRSGTVFGTVIELRRIDG